MSTSSACRRRSLSNSRTGCVLATRKARFFLENLFVYVPPLLSPDEALSTKMPREGIESVNLPFEVSALQFVALHGCVGAKGHGLGPKKEPLACFPDDGNPFLWTAHQQVFSSCRCVPAWSVE